MHVLLVSSKFEGEIELRYNERGLLDKYEYRAKMDDEMLNFFFVHYPITQRKLEEIVKHSQTLRIKEVPIDITFTSFWERYNRKINRKRCEPLYEKLDESEKVKCIMAIKQYDFFVQLHNRAKMDPENWLKRYGWETEWSKVGK